MSKTVVTFILQFVLLVLAQSVIFNNIVLFNVAVAFVFIYAIITMPLTWSTNVSIALGFALGLSVDVFADTQGLNALCCTILAFVRKPVFHLYQHNGEDLGGLSPSLRTMGQDDYLKYLATMVVIYCVCFFCVEAFGLINPLLSLLRIVCSSAFTFIVIYALASVLTRSNEKRL